jgi:sarcosine oxidase subunit alpha
MRVNNHPILPPVETEEILFTFAGKVYQALEGETIAAALLANGIRTLRYSEKNQEPRGLYCGIGHCYECQVMLDGVGFVRACITPVKAGMCLTLKQGGVKHES